MERLLAIDPRRFFLLRKYPPTPPYVKGGIEGGYNGVRLRF